MANTNRVDFRVLAQHIGIPLLSGDADKIIAFANAVAEQTRDATVEVCAKVAEPNWRITADIRSLIQKPKEPNEHN